LGKKEGGREITGVVKGGFSHDVKRELKKRGIHQKEREERIANDF